MTDDAASGGTTYIADALSVGEARQAEFQQCVMPLLASEALLRSERTAHAIEGIASILRADVNSREAAADGDVHYTPLSLRVVDQLLIAIVELAIASGSASETVQGAVLRHNGARDDA